MVTSASAITSANSRLPRADYSLLYAPGGPHTLYFLKKQSPDVWDYYSTTRVLPDTFLAAGHDESFINRAVALNRHIVGLPTDAEPPSAR
jgi:hypothetical protein